MSQLSNLTNAIFVQSSASSPTLTEQLNSTSITDIDVINMFNKAKSPDGNRHDLQLISKNLFTRKLKQLRKESETNNQINIVADILAIMFFNGQ